MPGPSRPMASSQGAVEHERDPRPSDGRPPRRTKPRAAHPLALLPATRKRRQHLGGQITPPAHGARRRARAGRSAPITTHTLGGSPLPARTGRCRARAGGRGRSRARGAHPRAHQKSSKITNFFQTNPTHTHQHHPTPPKNHHHPPKSPKNHLKFPPPHFFFHSAASASEARSSTLRSAVARRGPAICHAQVPTIARPSIAEICALCAPARRLRSWSRAHLALTTFLILSAHAVVLG